MYKITRLYLHDENGWFLGNHEILPEFEDSENAEIQLVQSIQYSKYTSFVFTGKYIN